MSLRIASAAVAAGPAFRQWRAIAGAPALTSVPEGEVVDVTFEPIGDRPSSQWVATAADVAAEVSVALATERRGELGEYGHRHVPGACGFCRRAAAAYR